MSTPALQVHHAIHLDRNENPLGSSLLAQQAAHHALQSPSLYPDRWYDQLKLAIATFHSVSSDQVTLGNGSENILELIVKSFLQKNHSAIYAQYAFQTIPRLLQDYGVREITAAAYQYQHDIHTIIQSIDAHTRMVFIVNPNNPTGTYVNQTDLMRLLNAIPPHVMMVVDEAYVDYIDQPDYPDTLRYLSHFPNLIITRTFSKIYGLAGLRLGYALSSSAIADILNRARLPYNVNSIAVQAGIAALQDREHIKRSFKMNHENRCWLEQELKSLGFSYIPSVANFISIEVGDAQRVSEQLRQQGIVVQPLNAYNLPRHIRVSIGQAEDLRRFLAALSVMICPA